MVLTYVTGLFEIWTAPSYVLYEKSYSDTIWWTSAHWPSGSENAKRLHVVTCFSGCYVEICIEQERLYEKLQIKILGI